MAVVCVRAPLRALAGGRGEHELEGATVVDLLRGFESANPDAAGWILDERGRIRRHINVFVNGERGAGDTAVSAGDRVDVIPAITGGFS
ncbi:MAG TPA: MoaD/ThiS family protein [Solirubrobacteraceae bacterium]|jgi:molybdopterin converting factor small subunit|nr:MoaD/ThiS family protein [Solirubrobacteraceae bacterium]